MFKKGITILLIVIIILLGGFYILRNHGIPDKVIEQNRVEEKYIKQFDKGDYTMDEPFIIVNPYQSNELAAYVGFKSDEQVSYEYTVQGDIPFTYTSDKLSNEVIIPVVALYNDTINKVEINTFDKEGLAVNSTTLEISTEESTIPTEIATADVTEVKESEFTQFMNSKFLIDNYTNVYDADGNLRGYNLAPTSQYAYLKVIGDKFLVVDKWGADSGYNKVIYSYSMMGRIDPDYYLISPEGTKFHHDFTQVGDKLYALTSSVSDDSEYADSMKESLVSVYSLKTGELEQTIDFSSYFESDDNKPNLGANANDLHLNSIDYYEQENMLILDSRSYSSFFGYSLDTNEVEWVFDDADTVGADISDLLLTPVGDVEYPSGEHTAFVANDYVSDDIKQDGDLYISVFDNRQCIDSEEKEITKERSEDADISACNNIDNLKSRGILYEINLDDKTIKTVWTIDFDTYTGFKGGFNMLANGYKETYVANATSYEVYNEDNELIGKYKIHTSEDEVANEDVPFLYRANSFTTETLQQFVELN